MLSQESLVTNEPTGSGRQKYEYFVSRICRIIYKRERDYVRTVLDMESR